MTYAIYCDGGSRGNPGPAGIGFVIYQPDGKKNNHKVLVKSAKYLGRATNNVAEYQAVIEALKWLDNHPDQLDRKPELRINFFLDSMLVVNQLNGLYKIKNAALRNLVIKVRQLENSINGQIFYQYIPREKNKIADGLVNQIINQKKGDR